MRCRLILASVLLAITMPARAQSAANLDELISIQDDGSAIIVERLQVASPTALRWRLRTDAALPQGGTRHLYVDLVEVTDAGNTRLRYERRESNDSLQLDIPQQPLADDTVRVVYNVRNAVQFHGDHDEVPWKVENHWSLRLGDAELRLSVPPQAVGQFAARAYGSEAPGPLSINGRYATWTTTATLSLPSLDVVFPAGILHPPSPLTRAGWFLSANPIVFFPVVVLVAMLAWRKWAIRTADITVVARYDPPEGLSPAEAGYLADDRLDPRDVAATLLDLAIRGYIRLEDCKPDEGVPFTGKDFILRLQKPIGEWAGTRAHEDTLLFHTFYGGKWTKLSSVSLRFYWVVPILVNQVRSALDEKGLYADPRIAQAKRQSVVIAFAVLAWIAQAFGVWSLIQSDLVGLGSILAAVVIVFLFTRGVNHRTPAGERAFAELRGFQDFMNSVDADRMQRITPDLFERNLPYAVALGVEHHWAQAFSTMASGPPLWWEADESATGMQDVLRSVGWFAQAIRFGALHAPRGQQAPRPPAPPVHSQSSIPKAQPAGPA